MSKPTRIYVLKDPRTDEIRYVGKTVRPLARRLGRHITDARGKPHRHCAYWIRSLLRRGMRPLIEEIESIQRELSAAAREIYWIARYKAAGCQLTNHTDGGEGRSGHRQSASTRQKLRIANLGRQVDAAGRANIKAAWQLRRLRIQPQRGENVSTAKLTEQQVEQIKLALAVGHASGELAEKFGVNKVTISNIKRGVRWNHVLPELAIPQHSHLTEPIVAKIKRDLQEDISAKEIATTYAVPVTTIRRIRNGSRWARVKAA